MANWSPAGRIGAKAAISTLVAKSQGGDAIRAFGAQLTSGSAAELFVQTVGWNASAEPGVNRQCMDDECLDPQRANAYSDRGSSIPQSFKNVNVFGLNRPMLSNELNIFKQSGLISRIFNLIPMMNAIA